MASGTRSPSGVFLHDDFRSNLIVDRYDVGFLTMRKSKTDTMRGENSEDALTWNVFRSLESTRSSSCAASSKRRSTASANLLELSV